MKDVDEARGDEPQEGWWLNCLAFSHAIAQGSIPQVGNLFPNVIMALSGALPRCTVTPSSKVVPYSGFDLSREKFAKFLSEYMYGQFDQIVRS